MTVHDRPARAGTTSGRDRPGRGGGDWGRDGGRGGGRDGAGADGGLALSEGDLDQMQVRSDDREPSEGDLDDDTWAAVRDDAVVDAVADAFNARDLDGLLDLAARDCEVPGLLGGPTTLDPAVGDLWNRRPSIVMTRVVDDDHALGVLWERAASDTWAAIGTVHVDVDDDRVRVLEFSDDVGLIDRLAPVAPQADDAFWPDADGLDDTPS